MINTKYEVYLSTKVKAKNLTKTNKNSGTIAVEPEDYTDAEIKAIKKKRKPVLAYLSIGSISTERSFYKKFSKYKKDRLEDWEKEYYMDMTAEPWTNFLIERAKSLIERGFDGLWLDNLDVYEYYKSTKTFNACKKLLKDIKALGKYVMVNGGSEFFDDAMDKKLKLTTMVDGVTQEEVISRITSYKGSGKFGTQKKDQSKWYKSYMKRLLKHNVQTFLLEYTKNQIVRNKIREFCKESKMTGYYISSNKDL